jgi:hypothetical protein
LTWRSSATAPGSAPSCCTPGAGCMPSGWSIS